MTFLSKINKNDIGQSSLLDDAVLYGYTDAPRPRYVVGLIDIVCVRD